MKSGFHSEWSDSLRKEGRVEALQGVVLSLLEVHAGVVVPEVRRRVEGCRDESRLRAWIQELSTAHRVKDLEG